MTLFNKVVVVVVECVMHHLSSNNDHLNIQTVMYSSTLTLQGVVKLIGALAVTVTRTTKTRRC